MSDVGLDGLRNMRTRGVPGSPRWRLLNEVAFVIAFRECNPIVHVSGSLTGAWKWRRTAFGIDMRVGFDSASEASDNRWFASLDEWVQYLYQHETVQCLSCTRSDDRWSMGVDQVCLQCKQK